MVLCVDRGREGALLGIMKKIQIPSNYRFGTLFPYLLFAFQLLTCAFVHLLMDPCWLERASLALLLTHLVSPLLPKDTASSAISIQRTCVHIYLSSGAVFSPRLRSKWRSTSEKLEWSDGSQPASPTAEYSTDIQSPRKEPESNHCLIASHAEVRRG